MDRIPLLMIYVSLAVISGGSVVWAVARSRPALAVFSITAFVYLLLRPIMLLTGVYSQFAIVHFGSSRFSYAQMWTICGYTAAVLVLTLLSYFAKSPTTFNAPIQRLFMHVVGNPAIGFVVWALALLLFAASDIFSPGAYCVGFAVFGASLLLLAVRHSGPAWLGRMVGFGSALLIMWFIHVRRDWAVLVIAFGWLLFFRRAGSLLKKVAFGTGMFLLVAAIAIGMRTEGSLRDRLNVADFSLLLPIIEIETDFSLVYDDTLILFMNVPRNEPYMYGQSLAKPLYSWVPREIWPSKPETLSRQFSQRFNPNFYSGGGSEPLTILGDLYWNFGWLGLPLVLLLGRFVKAIDDLYALGRRLAPISPRSGACFVAGSVTLAAMMFNVVRGPIDTIWLIFAYFFALLWFTGVAARLVANGRTLASAARRSTT